ncbi:MAG: GNAT family protein [Rhodospirillaceae bacterium]
MISLLSSALFNHPTVRLVGATVTLRPLVMRDWAGWAGLRGLSRNFLKPWEPAWPADALSRAAFARRLRRQDNEWRNDLGYSFLTHESRSGTLVGGLNLGIIRRGVSQSATIGYWVGEPFTRRGFTTEAVRLALDYAFGELKLHRVDASCLPDNQASSNLLQKLGFSYEGRARGYLRINTIWQDHLLYAILKEDRRQQDQQ